MVLKAGRLIGVAANPQAIKSEREGDEEGDAPTPGDEGIVVEHAGCRGGWNDCGVDSPLMRRHFRLGVYAFTVVFVVVHDVGDTIFGSVPRGLVLDAGALSHNGGAQGLAGDVDGGAAHIDDGLDGEQ